VAVLFVDDFKVVNDLWTYDRGSSARGGCFSGARVSRMRLEDTVARFGGDEFRRPAR